MKQILLIAVAALCIAGGSVNGSAIHSTGGFQPTDSISAIRRQYSLINRNLSKYRIVKKELSGFSTEGGELTAYFEGTAIRKIAIVNRGEMGRSFEDFYYRDEKLIFVYRKQDTFDAPFSGKVARSSEDRFYFGDDKLIRWIDEKAAQVAPGSSEYRKKQNEYLRASGRFVEGARSRIATIEAPADR